MSEVLLSDPETLIGREPPSSSGVFRRVETYYQFGEVEVDVKTRTVKCSGVDLKLGSRAFDLLIVLLRMRGTVADKQHIMHEVWPTTTVDDCNLRFQMSCLRRALGAHCDVIKTIPGRGYFFAGATVSIVDTESFRPVSNKLSSAPLRKATEQYATVAIVEDDEGVRESLDDLLSSFVFLVKAYGSSHDYLEAGPVAAECLILDVWLPDRSGLDVQAALKVADVEVPIIFISGRADIHISVKAMKAGAIEFLTKPVRHEEILSAVQDAVKTSRGRPKSATCIGTGRSSDFSSESVLQRVV